MKNSFKYNLLIVILGCILFSGCSNLLEPNMEQPAAGEGYFILNIGGVSIGKTILPATVQSDFAGYKLVFSSPTEPDIVELRTNANLGSPIALPVGTWDLEVTAYIDALRTKPAAIGIKTGIVISSGANVTGSLELKAIIEEGEQGSFKWNIDFPAEVVLASMTITPLDEESGTAEQVLYFKKDSPPPATLVNKNNEASPLLLNCGYYRVLFYLSNGPRELYLEEYLHIYQNLPSVFKYTFTQEHFSARSVTSGADSGPSTLRFAITNAPADSTIYIESAVTIKLESRLEIGKNLRIEGNGAALTRSSSWTAENDNSQLLYIPSGSVYISRLHFKDGKASNYGAAIRNYRGTVSLESCIFSGNKTSSGSASGGAVYNDGTMNLKGCTFYGNTSGNSGGALYNSSGGILSLTGNLFYGNTAASAPVVRFGGIISSLGYNAVDRALGTGTGQSGWAAASGDKVIGDLPVSPVSFRLLSGREAANVITSLPQGYPASDFYGNQVKSGAAAGAVQATAAGYYLDLSVNNNNLGAVILPTPNADGLYSGSINIEANPAAAQGYELAHWLVGGVKKPAGILSLTMNAHTKVQAVFARVVIVSDYSDGATAGTLRYALTNAKDWDLIRFSESTPGSRIVELTNALPVINAKITIEGNGAAITRSSSWTVENDTSRLLHVSAATVTVSRLHFKGGKATNGAAVRVEGGNLTLESCIFSGNKAGTNGGAVYNNGTLNIRGCTFYNNSSGTSGGAVYNSNTALVSFTGNIFYGNSATSGPVLRFGGTVTSGGFNLVDKAFGTGTGQSGWLETAGDKIAGDLPVSPVSFRPLSGRDAGNVITALPPDYPTADFYGEPVSGSSAAAGAAQQTAAGFYLDLTANNDAMGAVSVLPGPNGPNADGMYSGAITLKAEPAQNSVYSVAHWLLNGRKTGLYSPGSPQTTLALTMNAHTKAQAVFARVVVVNNYSDASGSENIQGTLRHAMSNAQDWDMIWLSNNVQTGSIIELGSQLPLITKKIIIEGNGTTLTRSKAWTDISNTSQFMRINFGSAVINISRLHFKGGRAASFGAAIRLDSGNLTLESCIFSDNRTIGANANGGVVYNSGYVEAKGCSFFGNASSYRGGIIYNNNAAVVLTGNLFYENTAGNAGQVVYSTGGTITASYNAVDTAFGTGASQCGWIAGTGDKASGAWPVSLKTFRLLSGSGAANVISSIPAGYPGQDFYGSPIAANAAAGAVQSSAKSGYYLDMIVNDAVFGTVNVSPAPDADGIISGSQITISTNPASGYELVYWAKDGNRIGYNSSLQFNMTAHTRINAAFGRVVSVFSDSTQPGTLRTVLSSAKSDDIIWLRGVTPGATKIELTNVLPPINVNLTIEGNGAVLTRSSTWTTINTNTQLLIINSAAAVVNVSRLHFKDGRASIFGAAVYNIGNLTLESCIFSDNKIETIVDEGGAIHNRGTLYVKGCSFRANSSGWRGGAIGNYSGNLFLTGNLFYLNDAFEYPVVYNNSDNGAKVTSYGYNAVNTALGTTATQSGWTAAIGDAGSRTGTLINATNFEPLANLRTIMPSAALSAFPLTDFNGNTRNWPGAPGAVN